MSLRSAALGLWLAFGWLTPSSGQVNTEAIRPHFDEAGWQGSFRVALGFRDGNSDTINLGAGFRLQHGVPFANDPNTGPNDEADSDTETASFSWRSPKRLIFVSAHSDLEEQDGDRAVNEGFAHVRWTEMVSHRWGWESFGQMEFDEFRNLDRRWLLGAGIRLPLIERKNQQLYLGTGLMGESQNIDDSNSATDVTDEESRIVRSTSYLAWRRTSGDGRFAFLSTFYVQPQVDDPDDFRLLEEAELDIALTQRLSLAISLIVRHDNEPPLPDIEKTDVHLTNRLRVKF